MKKYVLRISAMSLAIIILGAGCGTSSLSNVNNTIAPTTNTENKNTPITTNTNGTTNTNTEIQNINTTTNKNTNTSLSYTTKTFSDTTFALKFTYPEEWGDVKIQEYKSNVENKPEMKTLAFTKIDGTIFAGLDDPKYESEGRGGAWWDRSALSKSESAITNFCEGKTDCEVFTNKKGVTIAKELYQWDNFGETYPKTYYYYIFNPNTNFSGLVFSATALVKASTDQKLNLKDIEKKMDDVMQSISLEK